MLTPTRVGAKVDGGSPHPQFRPCLRRHHLVRRLLTRPVPRWICPPVSMERVCGNPQRRVGGLGARCFWPEGLWRLSLDLGVVFPWGVPTCRPCGPEAGYPTRTRGDRHMRVPRMCPVTCILEVTAFPSCWRHATGESSYLPGNRAKALTGCEVRNSGVAACSAGADRWRQCSYHVTWNPPATRVTGQTWLGNGS